MIYITVVRNKEQILKFEANGHSGYAEAGSDIVCSAVSTLLESLINGLKEVVQVKCDFNIDESIPSLYVSIDKDLDNSFMEKAQILMKTTYLGLVGVAREYTKFIKIKEKRDD